MVILHGTGCLLLPSMSSWLLFLPCPGPQEAHLCWLNQQVTLPAGLLPMSNSRFEREDKGMDSFSVLPGHHSQYILFRSHSSLQMALSTYKILSRTLSLPFLPLPLSSCNLSFTFECRSDKSASLLDPRYSPILVVSQHILYTIPLSSLSFSCQDPAFNILLIHKQQTNQSKKV